MQSICPAGWTSEVRAAGIVLAADQPQALSRARDAFLCRTEELGLFSSIQVESRMLPQSARQFISSFRLQPKALSAFMPAHDSTGLCARLGLRPQGNPDDLEREIILALLASPSAFSYPSFDELAAAIRIRQNIVQAASRTQLSFQTAAAERPDEYWRYHEDTGFTILPGRSLVTALQKATQPDESQRLFSFSCYRATEYVTLLGLAQELLSINPSLYASLQQRWETKAIMSGRFHEVFLREHGTMDNPMPMKYYVPGDRTWFRNPDSISSDACGYEGSWVMYLGSGLFSNFWNRDAPYTLHEKCVEIYHWRHGAFRDAEGEMRVDELQVQERVRASGNDRKELEGILRQMMRYRDPSGVYEHGGCIDTTREYVRWICPGTSDLGLGES